MKFIKIYWKFTEKWSRVCVKVELNYFSIFIVLLCKKKFKRKVNTNFVVIFGLFPLFFCKIESAKGLSSVLYQSWIAPWYFTQHWILSFGMLAFRRCNDRCRLAYLTGYRNTRLMIQWIAIGPVTRLNVQSGTSHFVFRLAPTTAPLSFTFLSAIIFVICEQNTYWINSWNSMIHRIQKFVKIGNSWKSKVYKIQKFIEFENLRN